jgi:DNA helicase-2/ATP-dependent DNA helicase PcrA
MATEFYNKCIEECYLDQEQADVLESNTHTIIKAGPGSGKTRVLTLKAAKLLFENVDKPRGIACITYTNKATQELKNRLNLYGIEFRKNLFVDTIHKFCINNILLPFSSLYSECDIQKCKIIKNTTEYFNKFFNHFAITDTNSKDSCKKFFKEYKYKQYKDQERAKQLYEYYSNIFYSSNCLNFDLVLDIANEIIKDDYVCKCIEAKYPYILIDEYQDSSIAMHMLFKTLINKTNIVFYIVGDPNQAIYGFTTSSPKYFNELYDSKEFQKIKFNQNYRTQNNIFTVVKNLLTNTQQIAAINTNTSCYYKKCSNLKEQLEYIISKILPKLDNKGILRRDICILYRDFHSENPIIEILNEHNIKFVDNNKVYVGKDYNDSDLVIFIEDIVLWLLGKNKSDKDITFKQLFADYIRIFHKKKIISYNDKKELKINLYNILTNYSFNENTKFSDFIAYIKTQLNIEKLLEDNNPNELEVLKSIIDETIEYSIIQFSEYIESDDSVRLLSAHSSKGLEYKVVIIPDLEDGRYPSWWISSDNKNELDEERRLLFVATTRAKDYLFVLYSGFYVSNNKSWAKGPSRFFNEIKSMFIDADNFN